MQWQHQLQHPRRNKHLPPVCTLGPVQQSPQAQAYLLSCFSGFLMGTERGAVDLLG